MNKSIAIVRNGVRIHRIQCSSTLSSRSSTEYCMNLVRQCDNENYMCTLLLSNSLRTTAFAIRAFNIEISKIQDQVSEKNIAQMRLKFWEECIEKIYKNEPPQHPVAQEIHKATLRSKLSKRYFKRLISSRAGQINSSSFQTINDMEKYADDTTTSVYNLLLESAGHLNVSCDHAASHLGKSQGLTNLIRSVPHNLKHKMLFLPQSILVKHNVSEESIFRGNYDESFREVIFEVASRASQHLEKARSLKKELPVGVHSIFLPAVCVGNYLDRLRREHFHIFGGKLNLKNPLLPFTLWWSNVRATY